MHDARVLTGCDMRLIVDAARKDVWASIHRSHFQPFLQRNPGLLGDLELNRTASLVLDGRSPVPRVTAQCNVIDAKADEVATAKFAVDSKVEHRQITFAVLHLKPDANGPNLFWLCFGLEN